MSKKRKRIAAEVAAQMSPAEVERGEAMLEAMMNAPKRLGGITDRDELERAALKQLRSGVGDFESIDVLRSLGYSQEECLAVALGADWQSPK